jgi:hypothetical protein
MVTVTEERIDGGRFPIQSAKQQQCGNRAALKASDKYSTTKGTLGRGPAEINMKPGGHSTAIATNNEMVLVMYKRWSTAQIANEVLDAVLRREWLYRRAQPL